MRKTIKIFLLLELAFLASACSLAAPKDDWLEDGAAYSQDAGSSSTTDSDLSNVGGHGHTGHR